VILFMSWRSKFLASLTTPVFSTFQNLLSSFVTTQISDEQAVELSEIMGSAPCNTVGVKFDRDGRVIRVVK